jgi:phospholipid-translocating ATPase
VLNCCGISSGATDCDASTSCVGIDVGGIGAAATAEVESLSIENVLWCNTVLCSSAAVGCVIYTGADTRAAMNTSLPSVKTGACEEEINASAKLLFIMSMLLSGIMTVLKGSGGTWVETLFRFVILFSSIIPISLRVNMDMSKTFHTLFIGR